MDRVARLVATMNSGNHWEIVFVQPQDFLSRLQRGKHPAHYGPEADHREVEARSQRFEVGSLHLQLDWGFSLFGQWLSIAKTLRKH